MSVTKRTIAVLAALVLTTLSVHAQSGTARSFVDSLYRPYLAKGYPGQSLEHAERLFTPALVQAIDRDQRDAARRKVPPLLNGDPFIDAQDWDIRDLVVSVTENGERATGEVTFRNQATPRRLTLDLLRTPAGWRIDNIRTGNSSLRTLLALAADTVTVGLETKNAFGTVVEIQSGDIACYLTLKDDRGKTFKEMADFSICQRMAGLLNKRVALTYKLERTQSPDCRGNPDCKRSVAVALVSEARPAAVASAPAPTERTSLCTASEDIIFSCRSTQKMVSVCASNGATATSGSLVYRFGDVAPDKPVTLTLPRDKTVPSKAATGAFDPFAGGGGAWLRFTQGEYANTVYSGIGKWGPNGERREKAGLLVERKGEQVALMKCSGKFQSELGPDLIERFGTKPGDQSFDYPEL